MYFEIMRRKRNWSKADVVDGPIKNTEVEAEIG